MNKIKKLFNQINQVREICVMLEIICGVGFSKTSIVRKLAHLLEKKTLQFIIIVIDG